ncbi:MAG: transcriptional regulator [Burkholderiales bacterium]|nr:MAG: transcriptional regulator [Burkholderiales bacterium]
MNLFELGRLVQIRREALGLSQDRLAKLSGLSRATINQLENGTLVDLGAAKLIGLLNLVGIELGAEERRPRTNALALLSQTASVSYKSELEPAALAKAMVGGELPRNITPHIATLLDEAPLQLILSAVEQVAKRSNTPPKILWKHLVNWAHELHSPRAVWA